MISQYDRKYFIMQVGKLKKDTPNELSCCCPACGDTKNRLHLVNVPTEGYSYVKCFNSGCELEDPTTVLNFLKITNSPYISAYKREAFSHQIDEIKSGGMNDIAKRLSQRIKTDKTETTESKPKTEIPLSKLFKKASEYPEAVAYLKERNIEVQDDWYFSKQKFFKFEGKNVFIEDFLLIPIYTDGKYRGFYSRSIHEKKFSTFLLQDTEKLWRSIPDKIPEIICEGVFDAISSGYTNSGAMLGADLSPAFTRSLNKDTIFAFDNDITGIQKSIKYSKLGFKIFVWPECQYKDFNEMAKHYKKSEIADMIKSNIFKGIQAEARLRMKAI